ncbi:MAG: type 4a pilus biogenesis protein PilO, partial [Chromatiales bacterium]
GLEFDLFQPQSEISREFYAELPIRIQVQGAYHEFGDFVSGLAALPRIVTIHDVNIQPQRRGKQRGRGSGGDADLTMTATAKTYRYLDEGGN